MIALELPECKFNWCGLVKGRDKGYYVQSVEVRWEVGDLLVSG